MPFSWWKRADVTALSKELVLNGIPANVVFQLGVQQATHSFMEKVQQISVFTVLFPVICIIGFSSTGVGALLCLSLLSTCL